jgi:HSP20 family molecular chaperone IbpA
MIRMEKITMNGYSRDMFKEMDEIFDHLFARMQDDFMTGGPQPAGFRVVFGNRGTPPSLPDGPSPHSRASAIPVTEIHRLDDEVKVIAELPGSILEQIRLEVRDSALIIDAGGIGTPYHTTAELPPVDKDTMQSTFRNGVLEVTFRILS